MLPENGRGWSRAAEQREAAAAPNRPRAAAVMALARAAESLCLPPRTLCLCSAFPELEERVSLAGW